MKNGKDRAPLHSGATEGFMMAGHKNAADLIGREFGRLVVVSREGTSKHGNALWLCRCECLGSKIVAADSLLSGNTKSCGCVQREHAKRHGSRVMATHPRRRGRLLAIPHYEVDPKAVADHSPCRVPWERYDIVFRPDPKLLKGPPGRPRLPAEEVARRASAKKPPGRPCQDPGKQVMRECLWRIEQAARSAWIDPEGIGKSGPRQLQSATGVPDCNKASVPEPPPSPSPTPEWNWPSYKSEQPEAWARLPWRERKAVIWERARAA